MRNVSLIFTFLFIFSIFIFIAGCVEDLEPEVEYNFSNPMILQCNDSDGGLNYDEKGKVSLFLLIQTNPEWRSYYDICLNETNVFESYCTGTTLTVINHECPNGCFAGACLPAPAPVCGNGVCEPPEENIITCPEDCSVCGDGLCTGPETPDNCNEDCYISCNESDNGIDYYNKGEMYIRAFFNGVFDEFWYIDTCSDDTILVEGYCDGDIFRSQYYECADGCYDGACSAPAPICGNGVCEQGEDLASCPEDCSVCGDGLCTGPETPDNCNEDCYISCNESDNGIDYYNKGEMYIRTFLDGVFDEFWYIDTCSDDTTLVEGYCDGDIFRSQYYECADGCYDGACSAPAPICGNGVCEQGEDIASCPEDCSVCGDGLCTGPETPDNCNVDCYISCNESDNGIDYYNKGEMYIRAFFNGVFDEFWYIDICSDDTTLVEGYCDGNVFRSQYYECPYLCFDGKCTASVCGNDVCEHPYENYSNCPEDCTSALCIDSDGGADYYTKSNVFVRKYNPILERWEESEFTEYCYEHFPEDSVVEIICQGDEAFVDLYKCPNGCADGRCIQ